MGLALRSTAEESTFESITHLNIMWEINENFGSLFVVENGEVKLGHPSVRKFFLPENTAFEDDHP